VEFTLSCEVNAENYISDTWTKFTVKPKAKKHVGIDISVLNIQNKWNPSQKLFYEGNYFALS
jgi:hypothetical protein